MNDFEIKQLRDQIRRWRSGDSLPKALVNFPRDEHPCPGCCGVMYWGQFVGHFISEISNSDLLAAIIVEPSVGDDSRSSAIIQSMSAFGLAHTATLLSNSIRAEPSLSERRFVKDMFAKLRCPCLRLEAAHFDKHRPMPLSLAWATLRKMQGELEAGASWADALERAQAVFRDEAYHKPGEQFFGPTHLSYAGVESATRDYKDLITGQDLQGGNHLLDSEKSIWLHHVKEYFDGIAASV
jgi:hypothetical protein